MPWKVVGLYACANDRCRSTYPATTNARKAAWHWLIWGHAPLVTDLADAWPSAKKAGRDK